MSRASVTARVVKTIGVAATFLISVANADQLALNKHVAVPIEYNDRSDPWGGEFETLLVDTPQTIEIAAIGAEIDSAAITDVEVVDLNGDGRNDMAVAWFVTDTADMANNVRALSIYLGAGDADFVHLVDIDLYVPDYFIEQLSIFRNGSADIGVGDFDGDGDPDLAVTPYFGDELWFIENLGGGAFAQHLKFPFGFNSTGNFQTSPEATGADFDGDGRDEFVCIADPISYLQGDIVHFWSTDSTIDQMERMDWEGAPGAATIRWTRALAVADFDGDELPDLCFTGAIDAEGTQPIMVFWYGLDAPSGEFSVHVEYPSFICSDVAAIQNDPDCPPGVILTDINGQRVEFWESTCDGNVDFVLAQQRNDFAGYSTNRGMVAAVADVDGDGFDDVVTKQRVGDLLASNQIEIALSGVDGRSWYRVSPTPVSTYGFQAYGSNEILRPRSFAVADLFGSTLPEIVAAFEPGPPFSGSRTGTVLEVAYWANSCVGDVTRNGVTNFADLGALLGALGSCGDQSCINRNADLNKDGVIDLADLSILLADYGCNCLDQ